MDGPKRSCIFQHRFFILQKIQGLDQPISQNFKIYPKNHHKSLDHIINDLTLAFSQIDYKKDHFLFNTLFGFIEPLNF